MAPPLPSLPLAPPAPAVSASVTFNGQSFNHLPAQLASALANLPDLPQPSHRRQRIAYPLPVSFFSFFFWVSSFMLITYSFLPLLLLVPLLLLALALLLVLALALWFPLPLLPLHVL